MFEPDFTDTELVFGHIRFARGAAFAKAANVDSRQLDPKRVPVGKFYDLQDGRRFLIEGVEYQRIRSLLTNLPPANVASRTNASVNLGRQFPTMEWILKGNEILDYQLSRVVVANLRTNFLVLSITTAAASDQLPPPLTYAYDADAFAYSWFSAFLYGHEATGWGEPHFSATSEASAPFHNRPSITCNPTRFDDPAPPATPVTWTGGIATRQTDTGAIYVNTTTQPPAGGCN